MVKYKRLQRQYPFTWFSSQVFLDFNGEESVYYYVETYIILFFNLTNLANFSLLTHFAFIFFAVWSVSLSCAP
jgi:hypothetical protein